MGRTPHGPLGNCTILVMTLEMKACGHKPSNIHERPLCLAACWIRIMRPRPRPQCSGKDASELPKDKLGFSQFPDLVVRLEMSRLRQASSQPALCLTQVARATAFAGCYTSGQMQRAAPWTLPGCWPSTSTKEYQAGELGSWGAPLSGLRPSREDGNFHRPSPIC